MAKDPLPRKEPVNATLDSAAIRMIFEHLQRPDNEADFQESRTAIQTLLHTSFLPALYTVAEYANMTAPELHDTGLERQLLRVLHANAHRVFGPPWSREHLYELAIVDWLIETTASDCR